MIEADVATDSGFLIERCSRLSDWDAFVASDSDATFCHSSAWRHVLADVLGHECEFLVARSADGEIRGALPLTWVRAGPLGHFGVSQPFLNYGGPIGSPTARSELAHAAARAAAERGVALLELRSRLDTECDLSLTHRKVAVVLPLPSDSETLWNDGLRSKVRSQVRRPRKAGMTARLGTDQLEAFYRVFAENMRDLGTPVLPIGFFRRIVEVFGDRVELCVVRADDVPVAAGLGFVEGGEFEITWASSLREYSREAPNMLLYWALMERMIERGVKAFNFGRTTPDSGTHRFKKQWGGEDVPLPWRQWSPDGVDATPNADRPLLSRASAIWSRLPLPVANRLGPVLARRLP
jgi:FemAB-related protein (PEP-CTERM system-associated)